MASLPASEPDWLASLNPPQRDAVLTTDGPVLVLAGAGTGKTKALTARLAYLLATRRAWPSELLAVTFTNKAAREMRERLAGMIGPAAEGMPWLGTFHAIAAKQLRRHAELVGLKPNFTILDTDDQLRLLKQLISEANIEEKRWPARALASLIDRWKNKGWTPDAVPDGESFGYADGQGAKLYARYQERLRALNAADFGDLLLHMITVLRTHADVRENWRERYKYALVDEYQDTNAAQYIWLKLLVNDRHNLCCVGDDDQSIYSWRGAEVANILRFEHDFPNAKTIRLEQNYRSTPHILGAASGVIAKNSGRLGKELWTALNHGEKVSVVGVWDGPEEARLVGERAERLSREGASLDSVAILVRAQHQTREFEERFISIGLPYRIVGGFRFYERAEIRDALAYLRLVNSPDDALAFERIVNVPKRGLGDKAQARIAAHARAAGTTLPHAAAAIIETDELGPAPRRQLATLVTDLARWRAMAATTPHHELVQVVLEESGYVAMLQADRSAEAAGRLENLTELARAMEGFSDLQGFLEHVSLVMENDRAENTAKVTIMTLHAAKGLEFDHVFLPGWEEGLFPSQRSLDEGGQSALEEERRLAYVGITRAKRRATILHAANRRIYGQWNSSIPSRFIGELPPEHIDTETTMTGGASLWRATTGAHDDPFAHVLANGGHRDGRGPGWERAASTGVRRPTTIDARPLAVTVGGRPRSDVGVGDRVTHARFGGGTVTGIEGNKLAIDFDEAGQKMVLDSFVTVE